MRKKLEDMNVLDDFLWNAIANDPDVGESFFREVLSVLLEREIGDLVVRAQTIIPGDTPLLRGVQLDVEIWENTISPAQCRLYNLEAQEYMEQGLERRSRFYQAKKDSKHLKRGEKNWMMMPDLYMIMITTYDPFGEGSVIYTFENTCKEYPEVEYKDGLKFIYFNTVGTKGGTESIKQLLSYLKESKIENVKNESTSYIHNCVSTVKQSAEVRNRFMTVGEWLDRLKEEEVAEARAEGRAAGQVEGQAVGLKLGRMYSLLDVLMEMGQIPEGFEAQLQGIDEDTLKQWIKIAVKANSIEAFMNEINTKEGDKENV